MKYFLMFVFSLMFSASVFAQEQYNPYIRYEANQIVGFALSEVPGSIDVFVDINGNGEADIAFVSPKLDSYSDVQGECDKGFNNCTLHVKRNDVFLLSMPGNYKQYIYVVSENYILSYRLNEDKKYESVISPGQVPYVPQERADLYDPNIFDPEEKYWNPPDIDFDDPLFQDQFREPDW